MSRWVRFIIAIILGIGLGLVYGWVIDPPEYTNTSPSDLRQDFKTDYVLMVAEMYQAEGDAQAAARRLTYLGNQDATKTIQAAIDFANEHTDYPQSDLRLIQSLLEGVQSQQESGSQ
jgi:hypothetical protein